MIVLVDYNSLIFFNKKTQFCAFFVFVCVCVPPLFTGSCPTLGDYPRGATELTFGISPPLGEENVELDEPLSVSWRVLFKRREPGEGEKKRRRESSFFLSYDKQNLRHSSRISQKNYIYRISLLSLESIIAFLLVD